MILPDSLVNTWAFLEVDFNFSVSRIFLYTILHHLCGCVLRVELLHGLILVEYWV